MLPGRQLIDEIESQLDKLDVSDWELPTELEQYILDNGDELLEEWEETQKDYSDKREQLNLMFDSIQSAVYTSITDLENRLTRLEKINDQLDGLIEWEDEDEDD
ncbi:MAG: hypothetical protein KKD66_23090 [Proteobacteria bacterium]|nr:hypothetical protein [Pseudomonadota bacterium]MBU2452920.1 hypothetical protein [Pseudomonadota bacterium]